MKVAIWSGVVLLVIFVVNPASIVRLSPVDPWWVTASLLIGRLIGATLVLWWTVNMAESAPPEAGSPWRAPWNLSWYWCLTAWLWAVAVSLFVGMGRVAMVGHIREQNEIGLTFRVVEMLSVLHFAVWTMLAFRRWRNPDAGNDASGL